MMWTDSMRHIDKSHPQALLAHFKNAPNNERFQGMAGKGKE